MMLRVEGLDGFPALDSKLRRMQRDLANTNPLLREVGIGIRDWVERNFDRSGRLHQDFPSGWPRLTESTRRARRRRGLGSKPLQATGRLRNSVRARVAGGRLAIDNTAGYAAIHQQGIGVPRRAFFPETDQLERLIAPIAESYTERQLR